MPKTLKRKYQRKRKQHIFTLSTTAYDRLRAAARHYNTAMSQILDDLIMNELQDRTEPKAEPSDEPDPSL